MEAPPTSQISSFGPSGIIKTLHTDFLRVAVGFQRALQSLLWSSEIGWRLQHVEVLGIVLDWSIAKVPRVIDCGGHNYDAWKAEVVELGGWRSSFEPDFAKTRCLHVFSPPSENFASPLKIIFFMDLASIASSYGEGVLNILAERLTINSARVKNAYLRPIDAPLSAKVDVTKGFSALIYKQFTITDQRLSPQELANASATRGAFWTGYRAPAVPEVAEKCWLCVIFSVPGGSVYMVCYVIPDELVTFPPAMLGSSKTIMSPSRQVTFSAILLGRPSDLSCNPTLLPSSSSSSFKKSTDEEEEKKGANGESSDEDEDEDEDENVLDITSQVRAMLGPDGTAFGRGWVDIRLAVADSVDEFSSPMDKAKLLDRILSALIRSTTVSVVVDTADGTRKLVSGSKWIHFAK